MTTSKPRVRASFTARGRARPGRGHRPGRTPARRPVRRDVQLLDGGRAPHVGRDEERVPALPHEPARELAARRRLARALHPRSSRMRGDADDAGSPPSASPKSASISSRTMRITCCPGLRLRRTSGRCAVAHAVDEGLDDLEVASASSRARRISRSAGLDGVGRQADLSRRVREDVLEALLRESTLRDRERLAARGLRLAACLAPAFRPRGLRPVSCAQPLL